MPVAIILTLLLGAFFPFWLFYDQGTPLEIKILIPYIIVITLIPLAYGALYNEQT